MPEQHTKGFRGVWIPPEIFQKVESKELSIKEAWLLAVIDSLVHPNGSDCFASNKYLANRLGLSEERIRKMISNLKKQKLLIQTAFDGRKRYLRTVWSTLEMTGQTGQKRPGRQGENDQSKEGLLYIDNKIKNKDSLCRNSEVATASEISSVVVEKEKEHPRWKKFARQLAEAITKVRKVNATSKISGWSKQFKLLYTQDKIEIPRIRKVLQWYCKELPGQDKYLPVVYSGATFREKFLRIEDAMKRKAEKEPQNNRTKSPVREPKKKISNEEFALRQIKPEMYQDESEVKIMVQPIQEHIDGVLKYMADKLAANKDDLETAQCSFILEEMEDFRDFFEWYARWIYIDRRDNFEGMFNLKYFYFGSKKYWMALEALIKKIVPTELDSNLRRRIFKNG